MGSRQVLSIAGITMALESSREFCLTDRCYAFRVPDESPDVTFTLLPWENRDFEAMGQIQVHENRSVYRQNGEFYHVCREKQPPYAIRWYLREQAGQYQVFIKAPDVWERINPLTFVELSEFMIRHEALILHASLIDLEGRGIAFTAPSGVGKSTQAALWKDFRGAEILNGDRAILRKKEGFRAYGSPYAGSSGIYVNKSTALTAIVVLRQAKYNRLRRLGLKEASLSLLSQISLSPISRDTVEKQTELLLELMAAVPVYLLECLPDQEAVETLYREWKENCCGE